MRDFLYICYALSCLYIVNCSFQTSLFKELNKQYINKNLIISPLSAYQILSLAANGAEGNTLTEMVSALGGKSLEQLNLINMKVLSEVKKFSTVEIANAIMSKFVPKQKFVASGQKYWASIEKLKSVAQVNGWCNAKTHGKINKILDVLPSEVKMLLLNAVYFKGSWSIPFIESNTMKKPFYNLNDKSKEKKVDRMHNLDDYFYYEDKEVQLIRLQYKKDSMSAIVILPNASKNINEFISELTDEKLLHLLKKMHKLKVVLELPKFELRFSSELNSVLQKLGMKEAFNRNAANFNGIGGNLYIDDVIQKTYLKVDEKGTEAAAVTAIRFIPRSFKRKEPKIYSMIVDRPFLFILRNDKFPLSIGNLFMSKIEKL